MCAYERLWCSVTFAFHSLIAQIQGDALTLGHAVELIMPIFPTLTKEGKDVAPADIRCVLGHVIQNI